MSLPRNKKAESEPQKNLEVVLEQVSRSDGNQRIARALDLILRAALSTKDSTNDKGSHDESVGGKPSAGAEQVSDGTTGITEIRP